MNGPSVEQRETQPLLGGVRRTAKQTLFSVGYYHQRLAQVAFRGVVVLCYHSVRGNADATAPFNGLHVTRETFERHCRLIARTCHPISLDDLRAARAGVRQLPARPVILTFDDGYRGVLDHALPVLEQYRVPAAVFVCSTPMLRGQHFWFDALGRRDGEDAVLTARRLPYREWRQVADRCELSADLSETHRPLTLEELRRLAQSPMIEIGGHTMTHPTLALAPIEEQRAEITAGCATLQEALGEAVTAFAYPYGGVDEDYALETVGVVRGAGLDLAFSTQASVADVHEDPLQIPRFVITASVTEVELAHRLAHSWRRVRTSA